jgi:hypothetical protein
VTMPTLDLGQGIYLITISEAGRRYTRKVIVQ